MPASMVITMGVKGFENLVCYGICACGTLEENERVGRTAWEKGVVHD